MLKKGILVLIFLILMPWVSSADEAVDVKYSIFYGGIFIDIGKGDQTYLNFIEFYKGKFTEGRDYSEDFIEGSLVKLICKESGTLCGGNSKTPVLFEDINIREPGDYFFVVRRDAEDTGMVISFTLDFSKILSCSYKDQVIVHNEKCASEFSDNKLDNPAYCRESKILDNCYRCGCSEEGQICCINEKIEECIGKMGSCVVPSEEGFKKEVKVEEEVRKEEALVVVDRL